MLQVQEKKIHVWYQAQRYRPQRWKKAVLAELAKRELQVNNLFDQNLEYLWRTLDEWDMATEQSWVSWPGQFSDSFLLLWLTKPALHKHLADEDYLSATDREYPKAGE